MGHLWGISALRTKQLRDSDRAPKIAVENTMAGQFPDHQLQARIFQSCLKSTWARRPAALSSPNKRSGIKHLLLPTLSLTEWQPDGSADPAAP